MTWEREEEPTGNEDFGHLEGRDTGNQDDLCGEWKRNLLGTRTLDFLKDGTLETRTPNLGKGR